MAPTKRRFRFYRSYRMSNCRAGKSCADTLLQESDLSASKASVLFGQERPAAYDRFGGQQSTGLPRSMSRRGDSIDQISPALRKTRFPVS